MVLWIGQVEVAPLPGNTMFQRPALGGYMAAAAHAADEVDFQRKVARELTGYGVLVRGIQGVRRLEDVLKEKSIERTLAEAIEGLADNAVALGTLFTFQADDDS